MPHLRNDSQQSKDFFDMALEGLLQQTDPNWQVIIIDDDSQAPWLRNICEAYKRYILTKYMLFLMIRITDPVIAGIWVFNGLMNANRGLFI